MFDKSILAVEILLPRLSNLPRCGWVYSLLIILLLIPACKATPAENSENEIKTPTAAQTQDAGNNDGITVEEDSLIPPIPPSQVRANLVDNFVELRWLGTGSDIDVHYVIYRRLSNSSDWGKIATVPVQDDNRGEYIFNDYTIEGGHSYEYAITVFDHYEKESSLSETASVDINH